MPLPPQAGRRKPRSQPSEHGATAPQADGRSQRGMGIGPMAAAIGPVGPPPSGRLPRRAPSLPRSRPSYFGLRFAATLRSDETKKAGAAPARCECASAPLSSDFPRRAALGAALLVPCAPHSPLHPPACALSRVRPRSASSADWRARAGPRTRISARSTSVDLPRTWTWTRCAPHSSPLVSWWT